MHTTIDETNIRSFLESKKQFMDILRCVDAVAPRPWCVFGGVLRNIVWDASTNINQSHYSSDVDVGIFMPNSTEAKVLLESKLSEYNANYRWDVENYAFSHIENLDEPYKDLEDGLRKQLITITSIGITLDKNGSIKIISPLGLDDLITRTIRPTPLIYRHPERIILIKEKLKTKRWQEKWPDMHVIL